MTRRVHCQREAFTVYIGRAEWCPPGFKGLGSDGRFGNPFRGRDGLSISRHRSWFLDRVESDAAFRSSVESLRGEVLGCWCSPNRPCHGDVIVEWLGLQEGSMLTEEEGLREMALGILRSFPRT